MKNVYNSLLILAMLICFAASNLSLSAQGANGNSCLAEAKQVLILMNEQITNMVEGKFYSYRWSLIQISRDNQNSSSEPMESHMIIGPNYMRFESLGIVVIKDSVNTIAIDDQVPMLRLMDSDMRKGSTDFEALFSGNQRILEKTAKSLSCNSINENDPGEKKLTIFFKPQAMKKNGIESIELYYNVRENSLSKTVTNYSESHRLKAQIYKFGNLEELCEVPEYAQNILELISGNDGLIRSKYQEYQIKDNRIAAHQIDVDF